MICHLKTNYIYFPAHVTLLQMMDYQNKHNTGLLATRTMNTSQKLNKLKLLKPDKIFKLAILS